MITFVLKNVGIKSEWDPSICNLKTFFLCSFSATGGMFGPHLWTGLLCAMGYVYVPEQQSQEQKQISQVRHTGGRHSVRLVFLLLLLFFCVSVLTTTTAVSSQMSQILDKKAWWSEVSAIVLILGTSLTTQITTMCNQNTVGSQIWSFPLSLVLSPDPCCLIRQTNVSWIIFVDQTFLVRF